MKENNGLDGRPAEAEAKSGSCFYLLEQLGSCWNSPPHPNLTSSLTGNGAYRVAQMMKNLLTLWETWVQFLGQEDRLEKGMTTHSSILAWRIQWTEEIGRLQSMELQRVGHN